MSTYSIRINVYIRECNSSELLSIFQSLSTRAILDNPGLKSQMLCVCFYFNPIQTYILL